MTDDAERTYTDDEERTLALQLLTVTRRVYSGGCSNDRLARGLLCDLHAALFQGVRSHAGRIRETGRGTEYLVFGPNRSVRRNDCPKLLDAALDRAQRRLGVIVREPLAHGYELEALRIAIELHAEVVRIHPFEDGNGRTSRLIMNVVLVAAGLAPIEVEVFKQEYNECLNHYFRSKDLEPLVDLLLRTYGETGPKLEP